MIRRILIVLAVFMAVSLIALWVFTGGIGRIINAARTFTNPLDVIFGERTVDFVSLKLPWQPDDLQLGADISQYTDSHGADTQDSQQSIDDAIRAMNDAKTFGDPSPYRGSVRLFGRNSYSDTDAREEYIQIQASTANTAPVSLSGWSIQSIATGLRFPLPPAATLFVAGSVNPALPVRLDPGAVVIVNSGASPVGVSFRENVCSGYLSQFQQFTPSIDASCPDPRNALPQLPENIRRYGASCFAFVQRLQSCQFPQGNLPTDLSLECANLIRNTFTYNGCVNLYQSRSEFERDIWRLFLNVNNPLWKSSHDVIRLLDAEGRTVDILKY